MKKKNIMKALILLPGLLGIGTVLYAQPKYTPLPVTGFNVDMVAESGAGALDATSEPVDGSLNALYSKNFATAHNLAVYSWSPLGGLPDNGVISNSYYN